LKLAKLLLMSFLGLGERRGVELRLHTSCLNGVSFGREVNILHSISDLCRLLVSLLLSLLRLVAARKVPLLIPGKQILHLRGILVDSFPSSYERALIFSIDSLSLRHHALRLLGDYVPRLRKRRHPVDGTLDLLVRTGNTNLNIIEVVYILGPYIRVC
jgi:hypothetical protein